MWLLCDTNWYLIISFTGPIHEISCMKKYCVWSVSRSLLRVWLNPNLWVTFSSTVILYCTVIVVTKKINFRLLISCYKFWAWIDYFGPLCSGRIMTMVLAQCQGLLLVVPGKVHIFHVSSHGLLEKAPSSPWSSLQYSMYSPVIILTVHDADRTVPYVLYCTVILQYL